MPVVHRHWHQPLLVAPADDVQHTGIPVVLETKAMAMQRDCILDSVLALPRKDRVA